MPKSKVLSGQDIVGIFQGFGFAIMNQRGSHIKLRRTATDGTRETLTISNHKELDRGTIVSLFKQGARYISEQELKPHFYMN